MNEMYHLLPSGDNDKSFSDRNSTKSDFKRNQSDDSIYEDKRSEGRQMVSLPQKTLTQEGSDNITRKETE